jgi:hypothetical protein
VVHPDFAIASSDSPEVVVEELNGLVQFLNPMLITTILHEATGIPETA